MNLWAKKLGLALLSALAFLSCEDDKLIGLPPENNLGIFFVEIPLEDRVSQTWLGNIRANRSTGVLLGSVDDPQFGKITSNVFTDLSLSRSRPELSQNAAFDSLTIKLRIVDSYGAVENGNFKFDLFQTTDRIGNAFLTDINTIEPNNLDFFNSDTRGLGDFIGSSDFTFYQDSLNVTLSDNKDLNLNRNRFDAQGTDSMSIRYIYQAKIDVDEAFAQKFWNKFKNDESNNTDETDSVFSIFNRFDDFIKGVAIVGAPTNKQMVTFQFDGNSIMTMYYTQPNTDGIPEQDSVNFFFNSDYSGADQAFNEVTPNALNGWSGSAFDELTSLYEPFTTSDGNVYFQTGTHLAANIDLSDFSAFKDTIPNALIQSADLVIKSADENPVGFDSLTVLSFSLTDKAELLNENFSRQSLTPTPTAFMDTTGTYTTPVALYLQNVVDGESTFDQMVVRGSFGASLSRMVVKKENIFFRIYYTIPNKTKD